jgi:hypothetical protein
MEDFFVHNRLQQSAAANTERIDGQLGSLLLRYLRDGFESEVGAWVQQRSDDRTALRYTCHAAEVLHRMDLDAGTAAMVQEGGDWLINLPQHGRRSPDERRALRLYPSRFKTLAVLDRFDDRDVQADFLTLLSQEEEGLVQDGGEPRILTTCIVLETLLLLKQSPTYRAMVAEPQCARITQRLLQEWRKWWTQQASRRSANGQSGHSGQGANGPSRITNARDLSYVVGLLCGNTLGPVASARLITFTRERLLAAIKQPDALHSADASHLLYAALQLAHCFAGDAEVASGLAGLLAQIRNLYSSEACRDWDFLSHTTCWKTSSAGTASSAVCWSPSCDTSSESEWTWSSTASRRSQGASRRTRSTMWTFATRSRPPAVTTPTASARTRRP